MRCASFKMALCHDRMYIIGLLACADHFTTKLSIQSQMHTSRSPSFNVDSRSMCVGLCECVRGNIVTQQDLDSKRKTGHIGEPALRLKEEVHSSLNDHKQPCNVFYIYALNVLRHHREVPLTFLQIWQENTTLLVS